MEDQVAEVHLPAAHVLLLRGDRREAVERLDLVRHVVIGVVPDGILEALDRAPDHHAVVRLLAFRPPELLLEQPQLDVGIPVAVPYPPAQVVALPREFVAESIPGAAVELGFDLVFQRRGHLFIGVHEEDPLVPRHFADHVPLPDVPEPLLLEDPVGELAADLDGGVRAEAVKDDDFVAPLHAFETTPDLEFLVERDDAR